MIEIMTNRKNMIGDPMHKKGRMKGVNNLVLSSSKKIKNTIVEKNNRFMFIRSFKS